MRFFSSLIFLTFLSLIMNIIVFQFFVIISFNYEDSLFSFDKKLARKPLNQIFTQYKQLSEGIRIRIPQELDAVTFWSWNLDVVVFQSWNLDVVAFCPLKKRLGITMPQLICLRFSMQWCFSPRISISRFFGLGISMSFFLVLEFRCRGFLV